MGNLRELYGSGVGADMYTLGDGLVTAERALCGEKTGILRR